MPRKRRTPSGTDYEVGYCRPPKHHQWRVGVSGNPIGKKKGTKNGKTSLHGLMQRKVSVVEDAERRRITAHEGILLGFLSAALKGDQKAAAYLLEKYECFQAIDQEREARRVVVPRITKDMTPQEAAAVYKRTLLENAEVED